GRYVFPLDIEERLDDRERRLLARMERLRELHDDALRLGEQAVAGTASRGGATDGDGASGG
ncbi:MAG TPA: hypothetical protein VHS36_07545, partial [Candidatus Limnocylindrales bacterium]|nr:hypothetical protein [Candidatus Limnocylindrales bacterium]